MRRKYTEDNLFVQNQLSNAHVGSRVLNSPTSSTAPTSFRYSMALVTFASGGGSMHFLSSARGSDVTLFLDDTSDSTSSRHDARPSLGDSYGSISLL